MAHGLSLIMRAIGRDNPVEPREKRERDRSLRGKQRRKARRAARRSA